MAAIEPQQEQLSNGFIRSLSREEFESSVRRINRSAAAAPKRQRTADPQQRSRACPRAFRQQVAKLTPLLVLAPALLRMRVCCLLEMIVPTITERAGFAEKHLHTQISIPRLAVATARQSRQMAILALKHQVCGRRLRQTAGVREGLVHCVDAERDHPAHHHLIPRQLFTEELLQKLWIGVAHRSE